MVTEDSSLKSNARTPMEVNESGMVTQLCGDRCMFCGGGTGSGGGTRSLHQEKSTTRYRKKQKR